MISCATGADTEMSELDVYLLAVVFTTAAPSGVGGDFS
jgi:hypothetical protein